VWPKIIVILLTVWFWVDWVPYYVILKTFLQDVEVSDFHVFYMAGKSWLSGLNPYVNLQAHTSFVYPPTSLPFFGIFSIFNFELAAQLWTLMYLSFFATALLFLALTVRGERRLVFVFVATVLFLTSFPVLFLMQLSQGIELIIVSLSILSLVAERTEHLFASAVLLAVGTLLKGPAVFLLIYFVIFRRDLRYLANFLVSMLGIVGISLLVVPVKLYWYFMNILPTLYAEYSLVDSQSIVRLFYLVGLSKPALEAISVAGFVLLAVFAFYVNQSKWADSFGRKMFRADAMFLLNGLVILFLSPRSLIYPYVWIILPVALFLSALLVEDVKLAYLALIGFATCFLNSSYVISVLSLVIYPLILPTFLIGNLIMTLSIIPIYLCPNAIFHVKNQLTRNRHQTLRS